jgi:hypothetical protein
MSNNPTFLPILIFKHHTVLKGSIKTARSVTMLGTLELFAKTWTLKHLPLGMFLSQLKAKGMHWNMA